MEQAWKMQKNSLYCNARLRNKKEKMKRKKKSGSDVTENLWYKVKHVMNYLSDTKGEQNYSQQNNKTHARANAKWKKTYK